MSVRDRVVNLFRFKNNSSNDLEMIAGSSLAVRALGLGDDTVSLTAGEGFITFTESAAADIEDAPLLLQPDAGYIRAEQLYLGGKPGYAGNPLRAPLTAPASAAANGAAGTINWDANFIYICVANNTWKRVAIATW